MVNKNATKEGATNVGDIYIGVDLGGTTVKMGVFDLQGSLKEKWEIPTNRTENGKYILSEIVTSIEEKLSYMDITIDELQGIGVGIPGIVQDKGFVAACVNLGWKNVNVKEELESRLHCKVTVGSDANVAAFGEMWQGSAKGYKDVVMLTLGTGVGGGVVLNGKILTGSLGIAGELGHMPLVEGMTEKCACGSYGCLEQLCSATGIVKTMKKRLQTRNNGVALENDTEITAFEVMELAKKNDELALGVIEDVSKHLAKALACISMVVNPQIFIIGGGVSKGGPFFLDKIRKYYQENVLYLCKNTPIELAGLSNDAGIYGAAKMAMEE